VITGFNTDVEHGGIVYHVQTEDKGLASPLLLTLVYTGGTILASKRVAYDELIAEGFDEHDACGAIDAPAQARLRRDSRRAHRRLKTHDRA
jgi:hypothetical protein